MAPLIMAAAWAKARIERQSLTILEWIEFWRCGLVFACHGSPTRSGILRYWSREPEAAINRQAALRRCGCSDM